MSVQYGGDKITFSDGSTVGSGWSGFKNRIINGDMRIDQRNAGASVTPLDTYTLDRWQGFASVSSKYTIQQNAGSVTPPVGFTNYLGVTSSSAYSVGSSDYFAIVQKIEGYNLADLAWGTADAKSVTLSFWVRSSLTGTFGGVITNADYNRTYPFSYTISAANTWEQKSVTITGDTTGTWLKTNGNGMRVWLTFGAGSSVSGTAGSWSENNYLSATGAVSVVGTNGATFYVTGVQLEKGSTATSFDYRPYGTELQLCQRYYYLPSNGTNGGHMGAYVASNSVTIFYPFKVTMRSSPTVSGTSATMNGTKPFIAGDITGQFNSSEGLSLDCCAVNYGSLSSSGSNGNPFVVNSNDVQFSAEL
jgi:hypothetical protein